MKPYSQMTPSEKEEIKANQKYECAICFCKTEDLVIDHDHETDEVRGALCSKCNVGLGMFEDDWENVLRAVCYLLTRKVGITDLRVGYRILVEDCKRWVDKWDGRIKREADRQLCQAKKQLEHAPADEAIRIAERAARAMSTLKDSEASKKE